MIIFAFLVFEFFCLLFVSEAKNTVLVMVEFVVSVEGSLFFKLKQIFGDTGG